ncbi:MAG: hypothetical protein JNM34_12430 [Chthonomonadaceae bacterium]|nr:hypothetical protein [Chthonomonadaceae bacterium]
MISLGQGSFTTTGNMNTGQVDTFSFSLSNDAKNYIANALNNGTDIRLVITPDSTDQNLLSVAATFAGFSINNLVGPTFEFDATGGGAMTGQIEVSAVGFQVVAFPCTGFDSANMVVTG